MTTLIRRKAPTATAIPHSSLALPTKINNNVNEKETPNLLHIRQESPKTPITNFPNLNLCQPLLRACQTLGYKTPTPVQRIVIPYLLDVKSTHLLVLSQTGSGKTASYVLPILHHLSNDCYGPYALILAPTRELARQIHQVVCAIGSSIQTKSILITGGMDETYQSCQLGYRPHIIVGTPGRIAALLRRPNPPIVTDLRFIVLDEADRLLVGQSGFESDVRDILKHCTSLDSNSCQTLLFSATMTQNLKVIAETSCGNAPLHTIHIGEDICIDTNQNQTHKDLEGEHIPSNRTSKEGGSSMIPSLPKGLRQEYVFMPSRVRDASVVAIIRRLMRHGGRMEKEPNGKVNTVKDGTHDSDSDSDSESGTARSAVIFVSTCERTALLSQIFTSLQVPNIALHSLLSQHRRHASLDIFKSQRCRVLIATDVASRGLDIPSVDLVVNATLPKRAIEYVHRVGRTARMGRRGRAISVLGERDVKLLHAIEDLIDFKLTKCMDVTDDHVVEMLGCVMKATRFAKRRLDEVGFGELVKKRNKRKEWDRMDRYEKNKKLSKENVLVASTHSK